MTTGNNDVNDLDQTYNTQGNSPMCLAHPFHPNFPEPVKKLLNKDIEELT